MQYLFSLMMITAFALTGCFDAQPPRGVIGDLVGCIEAENRIYCLTEYPVAPVNLETIVDDVLENSISFEQQIVTVTGEVTVFTNSIVLETGTDRVDFFVRDAAEIWDLETGKSYQMTVYIEAIDRDRHEYQVWSYPVLDNFLGDPAVPVAKIVDDTLKDTNDYTNNAMYLTGVVQRLRDDSIQLQTDTDKFFVSVYSSGAPDLISGYHVGSEVTVPVFLTYISRPGENQDYHLVAFDLVKKYDL